MAAKPVKVAFLADTADLRSSLAKAEASMDGAAATAKSAGAKIDVAFDSTAESADRVASKGSQAAGALSGLGDLIGGKFGAAMQAGGIAMQAAADGGDLLNVITESNIIRKIKDTAVTVGQTAATVAKTAADKAAAAAAKVWAAGQWLLNAALTANPIGLVVVAIAALVAGIIIAYKKSETFRTIVNKAFAVVKAAGAALKAGLVAGFQAIVGGISSVIRFAGTLRERVVSGFTAVVDFIRGVPGKITALGGKFLQAGKAVMGKIIEGIKSAAGFLGGIASSVWNAVKGLINSAIDKINGYLEFSIKVGPKTFSINPPDIPHLASGGIVTGPTIALIGEAGPEAVVPLSKGWGGNVYKIEVTVAPTASPVETGRAIVQALDAYKLAGGAVRV